MDIETFSRRVGLSTAELGQETAPASPRGEVPDAAGRAELEAANSELAGIYVTPLVRKTANRLGVLLSDLAASNKASGRPRITLGQVREAAGLPAKAAAPVRRSAAVAITAPSVSVTRRSLFDLGQTVTVNEYGANPLVEDIRQCMPAKHAAAIAAGDRPPTVFPTGDLPVFSASGIPVSSLAPLPWPARIPAAQASTQAAAAEIVNYYTPSGGRDLQELAATALMFYAGDPGNIAYQQRVESWLSRYVFMNGQWAPPSMPGVGFDA